MRRNETNDGATVQSLKLALARAEERIACQRENLAYLQQKNLDAETAQNLKYLLAGFHATVVIKPKDPKNGRDAYELSAYLPGSEDGIPDLVSRGNSLWQVAHQAKYQRVEVLANQPQTVSLDVTHIEKLAGQAREDFRNGKTDPWPPNEFRLSCSPAVWNALMWVACVVAFVVMIALAANATGALLDFAGGPK